MNIKKENIDYQKPKTKDQETKGIKRLLSQGRVLLFTMKLQMKKALVRPMYRFCLIANPIVNTILLYEMFLNSGQENFGTYVILGAGLMGLWGCICFSSAGDINRERWEGTLSLIFVAPSGFDWIIDGKILGNTLLSFLSFAISFVTARLLFGVTAEIAHPVWFLAALVLAVITFSIISKLIAYLLTLSRKTTLYMNCIELPIVFLCGFVVPVEIFPAWLRGISAVLPPTWAVKLLRLAVSENAEAEAFIRNTLVLIGLNVLYVAASHYLVRRMEKQIRIRASLEVS